MLSRKENVVRASYSVILLPDYDILIPRYMADCKQSLFSHKSIEMCEAPKALIITHDLYKHLRREQNKHVFFSIFPR